MPGKKEPRKRLSITDLKRSYAILKYIKPYRYYFYSGLLFLFLSSATVLVFPFLTGKLVDAATGKIEWVLTDINKIALGLTLILVFQAIFSYLRIILFAVVSEKAMADVRKALFSHIITLPVTFFERHRVGELTSRITADVTQLQETLSLSLAEFLRQITTLLVGVAVIFVTSPKLTLIMLATFPVLVIAAYIFGRFIRRLSRMTQDALASANIIVEETFQAIQIVKAFTSELYESLRYKNAIADVVRHALRAAKFRGLFVSFIIFALFGGIVLVLWYGATLVSRGEMTIGDLTAFIIYTTFIGGSIGGMGDLYTRLQKTIGATDRLMEIMQEKPEIDLKPVRISPVNRLKGDIVFQEVFFSYPSRPDVTVLKGISFHVLPGEKIALAGPSGAGKSTIIQLLFGFYRVDSGEIRIDRKPLYDYDLTELRSNMALVPQEVILFGGTIRENIAYGKPDATMEEIEEAARKANALEFILSFPDQFDTQVGERGVKLSGGQKQRIAIARAILHDPAILVLDEATSSLDAESEHLVQQALETLMKNRTTIIIAHRLSTIRKVDRIYVLDKGKIVESGTHEELFSREDSIYKYLTRLQLEPDN